MKVANDPQLSPTFLTNHLRPLLGPKTQQDYSQPSIPRNSAFNRQHHYAIGIFGIASDLRHTLVIGYRCYQSSNFDIGDYSSLFYFYLLTPMHVTPYCSPLSFLSLHSHAYPMLSSAIYSIYYSRYSTPYLSGEGEEGGLVGGGNCGERTRDIFFRRYRMTGIYTFG